MSNNVHSFKTEADENKEVQENSFFGGLSAEHLKQFIERVERLEKEKKDLAEDIKEIFAEAKGSGFDVPTMRQIIKIRKIPQADLEEQEYLLDTYKRAMGMLPLERYAYEREENLNAEIEVCGVICKLIDFTEATKITSSFTELLKAMERLGGYRANSDAEKEIAAKFVEFGLLKQPNQRDNLFMLTKKAEKLAVK